MAGKPTTRTQATESKLIRELAEILNDTDLNEIELKKGDLKIRVSKGGTTVMATSYAQPAAAPAPAAAVAPSIETVASEKPADASAHPGAVKSPMVGTAYIRPSPDADPFVKVGDTVKEGDTIMLVEAMKTFNPITAPRSGKISELLVEDAQPVEFGEALFILV